MVIFFPQGETEEGEGRGRGERGEGEGGRAREGEEGGRGRGRREGAGRVLRGSRRPAKADSHTSLRDLKAHYTDLL